MTMGSSEAVFLCARAQIAERSQITPGKIRGAGRREEKVTDNTPGAEATGVPGFAIENFKLPDILTISGKRDPRHS